MARLLYKPFGIIAGIIAGKLAAGLLQKLWGDAPHPAAREISTGRAVASAAVTAATFAGTKTAVDRASYQTFEYFLGGNPRPKGAAAKVPTTPPDAQD